jgi:hypothetical protein
MVSMSATMIDDAPPQLSPERLRAANIHPETRLATDYLNHFNEAIMLLELVPSMPDCIDDVVGWTPLSYEEHFGRSNYRDKDLVIAAFQQAPIVVRRKFLAAVAEMDAIMVDVIAGLMAAGPTPRAGALAREAAAQLKPLAAHTVGLMNAVIDEDDDLMAPPSAQDAIDALMDR